MAVFPSTIKPALAKPAQDHAVALPEIDQIQEYGTRAIQEHDEHAQRLLLLLSCREHMNNKENTNKENNKTDHEKEKPEKKEIQDQNPNDEQQKTNRDAAQQEQQEDGDTTRTDDQIQLPRRSLRCPKLAAKLIHASPTMETTATNLGPVPRSKKKTATNLGPVPPSKKKTASKLGHVPPAKRKAVAKLDPVPPAKRKAVAKLDPLLPAKKKSVARLKTVGIIDEHDSSKCSKGQKGAKETSGKIKLTIKLDWSLRSSRNPSPTAATEAAVKAPDRPQTTTSESKRPQRSRRRPTQPFKRVKVVPADEKEDGDLKWPPKIIEETPARPVPFKGPLFSFLDTHIPAYASPNMPLPLPSPLHLLQVNHNNDSTAAAAAVGVSQEEMLQIVREQVSKIIVKKPETGKIGYKSLYDNNKHDTPSRHTKTVLESAFSSYKPNLLDPSQKKQKDGRNIQTAKRQPRPPSTSKDEILSRLDDSCYEFISVLAQCSPDQVKAYFGNRLDI